MSEFTHRRRMLWGLVLAIGILVGVRLALDGSGPQEAYRQVHTLSVGRTMLVVIVLGLYLGRPFTGVPASVLSFFVGVEFGLAAGLPLVVVGTTVTGLPTYYFGHGSRSIPDWVPAVDRLSRRSEAVIEEVGVYRGMLAASLSPTPLDPVAYAAGLAGVPLRVFVGATAISAIPWGGAYCYLGAVTQSATGPGRPPIALVGGGAIVAVLLVAPTAYRWIRTNLAQSEH